MPHRYGRRLRLHESIVHDEVPLNMFLTIESRLWQIFDLQLAPLLSEGEQRKRKRKRQDARNYIQMARMVVANALSAAVTAPSKRVYYTRSNEEYSNKKLKGLYFPAFVGPYSLRKLIDLMDKRRWLKTTRGLKKKPGVTGTYSTFSATNLLIEKCRELGISHETLIDDNAPVLILRDDKKESVYYRAIEHKEMILAVKAFNAFIKEQTLELNVTDEQWQELVVAVLHVEDEDDDENELRLLPNFHATSLRRIFNNSDWHQGGRFYGGWWQRVPSKWRDFVRINGEATVELDYSGFLTRAIYHSKGLEYLDDPYDVAPIYEIAGQHGIEKEVVRTRIKLATNILINASADKQINKVRRLKVLKGLSRATMYELIEAHHVAIADKFRSGEGLRMMFRESKICQRILNTGIESGIAVLPIHDSYMVSERHSEWLLRQMEDEYQNEFGFPPVIK